MKIFGLDISRRQPAHEQKQLMAPVYSQGSWWPSIVRESYPGAWQENVTASVEDVTAYFAVYACTTLIASDIAKMRIKLVQQEASGIWSETETPAFSPVLRKPNHYQNRIQFVQTWIVSKLLHGNTYALKIRDDRNVVTSLYVLDPRRVHVLVAPNGEVFYDLSPDNLSRLGSARSILGLTEERPNLLVPASEIIHDVMCPLFHPLVGISPLYAAGLAALQGLKIQNNSYRFFANGSIPGAVISAPGAITQAAADRIKAYWDANYTGENVGKVAVLGDSLTYQAMTMTASDAQMIEQLKWTAANVCACFHVPPYMIGIPPLPAYNNIEALNQQYYAQALQNPIESFELSLDEGLGLTDRKDGVLYGVEMELDDLLRMDTATLVKTEVEKVRGGIGAPNESRKKLGLPPVPGGNTPYLQHQDYSLAALAKRDAKEDPFAKTPTAPPQLPASPTPPELPAAETDETERALTLLNKMAERLYAA